MTDLETKEKIMTAARILFAEKGYEGTSVRSIVTSAGVNIAALNYYFSTKENLFQEIMKCGHDACTEEIKNLLEKNEGNLENTMVDIFRYFTTNSHDLLSHFKLLMSAQHSEQIMGPDKEETIGPPGCMIITDVLKKVAPDSIERDIHWGLKTLFSHVVHHSIIYTCCIKKNKNIPFSSIADLEKGIRRLTRMVIEELKNPQHKI